MTFCIQQLQIPVLFPGTQAWDRFTRGFSSQGLCHPQFSPSLSSCSSGISFSGFPPSLSDYGYWLLSTWQHVGGPIVLVSDQPCVPCIWGGVFKISSFLQKGKISTFPQGGEFCCFLFLQPWWVSTCALRPTSSIDLPSVAWGSCAIRDTKPPQNGGFAHFLERTTPQPTPVLQWKCSLYLPRPRSCFWSQQRSC